MNIRKRLIIFSPLNAWTFLLILLGGCNLAIQNNNWAHRDLHYIRDTIIESHPGIYNKLDPNFAENSENNYKIAHNRLMSSQSDIDRMEILKEFITSFNDTHMQIRFCEQKKQPLINANSTKKFSITRTDQNFIWITLPTFEPDGEQQRELQKLYQELPLFRSEKALVFDIRGNGGGNSDWAKNIVTSLFGVSYACEHINRAHAASYVDWRATEDNLLHLIKVKEENEHNFDPNGDFMQWFSSIIDGMQRALETKQLFYTEKEPSSACNNPDHPKDPVKAKIFVVIDHACGSAALDFIDYLKAMQHSITLVGQTTKADSLYMEIRTIPLPSNRGAFAIPIKVYRNRTRGHNEPYQPDLYWDMRQDTTSLQNFISNMI